MSGCSPRIGAPADSRSSQVGCDPARFPKAGIPIPASGTRDNLPAAPGKRKIVCIGCSHTYGRTWSAFTWPSLLQALLPRHEFHVLNMGRRNYGLKLNIDWYHAFAAGLSPEKCILQVPSFTRQPFPGHQGDEPEHFTHNMGAFSLVRNRQLPLPEFLGQCPELIERDVARLDAFLESLVQSGVVPVVLLYREHKRVLPFLWDWQLRCHAKIEAVCSRLGVLCCAGDDLSSRHLGRLGMLWDETHPNELGNLFLARRVYGAAFCPPLIQPSALRMMRLRTLCHGAKMTRRIRNIFWRRRKKSRPKAAVPWDEDDGVPKDIYTVW